MYLHRHSVLQGLAPELQGDRVAPQAIGQVKAQVGHPEEKNRNNNGVRPVL